MKSRKLQTLPLDVPETLRGELAAVHDRLVNTLGRTNRFAAGVAACEPGEGASATALFLAIYAAEAGRRTLLVDMGAAPGLTGCLELREATGFTDMADKGVTPDQAIRATRWNGLSFMPIGTRPVSEGSFAGFAGMVRELKERFDAVYLDLPALSTSVRTLWALEAIDGLVWVVAASRTESGTLLRVKADIERSVGAKKILGVVLNRHERFIPRFLDRCL